MKVVEHDRQLTEATPGCVEDRIGHGGRDADHANLAEPFRAGFVENGVGLVYEVDGIVADVGVRRDMICGKVRVEKAAETRVDIAGLAQASPDSPNLAPKHLASGGAQ